MSSIDRLVRHATRPSFVLRLSGLAVCALEMAGSLIQAAGLAPSSAEGGLLVAFYRLWWGWPPSGYGLAAATIGLLGVFAAGYAWMTGAGGAGRHSRRALPRLALLNVVALAVAPGLPFVMTALAAVVLHARASMLFALAQVLVATLIFVFLPTPSQLAEMAELQLPAAVYVAGVAVSLLALHGIAFGLGRMAADEIEKRRLLQTANAELASQDRLQAEQVRFSERLQLTRDLHDLMGHHLAALSLNLQLADQLLARGEPDRAAGPLGKARLGVERLLGDVRETVSAIRSNRRIDLSEALGELASRIERPRIAIHLDPSARDLAPRVANTVLRCVQEAVTNAVRHAEADAIEIRVECVGDELRVSARDDGRGAPRFLPGNGIAGMAERMRELGGEVRVSSSFPGFAIELVCPREA